ncbi:MAG: hypothetical protein EVB11_08385 [Winogradskyella sp.]|nr:MAG: hypothetical protein EVB11_08385 [Winogradskyella sp.]
MSATNDLPPPGRLISTGSVSSLTISFQFGTDSSEILPPISKVNWQGSIEGGNLSLEVSNVVLIDSNAGINQDSVKIYWNESLLLPIFYIDYDAPNNPTNDYVAYEINFAIGYGDQTENLAPRVETILWDEDPRGSRGTITTVPPPTNP